MRGALAALASLALGVTVLGASEARANGRFPQATQLVVDPADASHVVVRATFGLLQSTDGAASFAWVCEASAGYSGMIDPPIAIASGSALLVGVPGGVRRSTDGACSLGKTSGLTDAFVIDLAVSPADPQRVVAVAANDGTMPGFQSYAALSADGGASWTQTTPFPPGFAPYTVELAASDPKRLIASGAGPDPALAYFERSMDAGATWTESTFPLGGANGAYVSAVDPKNPDRVYVRRAHDFGDSLDVSDTGGASFTNVFGAKGALLGFALSPDGSSVAIGGPSDGLWVASTVDLAFHEVSSITPRCLRWTSDAIYACGSELSTMGFAIGVSIDGGATWAPRFHLWDLTPLPCAASTTTGASCPDVWPMVQLRPSSSA